MTKDVVQRDDGRVVIYYAFADEDPHAAPDGEAPRPEPAATVSATESDPLVTEDAR